MERRRGAVLPPWFRIGAPAPQAYRATVRLLQELRVDTICQQALCPNRAECFSAQTASFLILGPNCTRSCTFCAVGTGIGFIPVLLGSRRTNCMGVLLLPIALNMVGAGDKVAMWLGLIK